MRKEFFKRASWTFAVALLGAMVIVGCGKEEDPKAAATPENYMNDPKFMAAVKAQEKIQQTLRKQYVVAKKAYEDSVKIDPNGKYTAELKEKMVELENQFQSARKETTKIVRERINPDSNLKK